MKYILPSTAALKTFEAAARLLSFTKASEELCVTQGAVSRQIKELEENLQQELFIRRNNNSLALTGAGRYYYGHIEVILEKLKDATQSIHKQQTGTHSLRIATLPTLGTRWLAPKLHKFTQKHPNIHIETDIELSTFDFVGSHYDIAIHYGLNDWPGGICEKLMEEKIAVVCAPSIAQKLSTIADIQEHTHIQLSKRKDIWQIFNKQYKLNIDYNQGPKFALFDMAIEAAKSGMGIAAIPLFLLQKELDNKELINPFNLTCKTNADYFIVYPDYKKNLPHAHAFRQWLLRQV